MATIAYILLCHQDPQAIIGQARRLTAAGDVVAIHFDARSRSEDFAVISDALKDDPAIAIVQARVKCGWGEWSLVQATLNAVKLALARFPSASHFYLMSGDCQPIKSAEYIHNLMENDAFDHIESVDFFETDWIKTGPKEDRLIYRHIVNERQHKRLFYALLEVQKRLGLSRSLPDDLEVMIGSQWWCLRRGTIEQIIEFCAQRPDVITFFRTTWIPDETFFQTLVRHLVPNSEISGRTPTFAMFSDYGMPVMFYNDHYDLLLSQDYLFARKISPEAEQLKTALAALYVAQGKEFRISGEGRKLYSFLAGKGRAGRRFAPRFWETDAGPGSARELLIITCKKWHVAKRMMEAAHLAAGIPALGYVFDEQECWMPDLGGIEKTLDKRARHRQVLARMLFEYFKTDRLILCLDPMNLDLMRDFDAERSTMRLLEIECHLSEHYLRGHAKRVGLASDQTSDQTMATVLPTLHADVMYESQAIRDEGFEHYGRIRETDPVATNAHAISVFLSIDIAEATRIAETDYLFHD